MQRKNKSSEKLIDGSKYKIAIVVSKFNSDITEKMLRGALEILEKNKVKKNNIKIVRVPGSFEIPLVCKKLAEEKKYDGLIAIGCVIKGDTDHYYYISQEVSRGIMNVMLEFSLPIGFGVITTNNLQQAKNRSNDKCNKGKEAAEAVLEIIDIDFSFFRKKKSSKRKTLNPAHRPTNSTLVH
jgi:6,7-dimethyl-8-ribityllumazine synthase